MVANAAKKITVPATIKLSDGYTYTVVGIAANAFKGFKAKRVVVGSNVTSIAKKAFNGAKKLVKVTIKSKKLTKKSVKGCFKGAKKLKTVKVPKAKKKAYKKIFTKKNCGKKVSIK